VGNGSLWVGLGLVVSTAFAACSSTSTQPPASGGTAGTTSGGAAGTASGGAAGATSGGSGGATGGSAGATTGGSGGQAGGAAGSTGDASAAKRVFVTSQRYYGDLKTQGNANSGLLGGNALCAELAKTAGLGDGPWVAWLSAGNVGAYDRITGNGPWERVDGVPVFTDRAALKGAPQNPISVNEKGLDVSSALEVWTGTDYGGTPAGVQHCSSWNGGTASFGQFGLLDQKDAKWTNGGIPDACDVNQHRLYCFEI